MENDEKSGSAIIGLVEPGSDDTGWRIKVWKRTGRDEMGNWRLGTSLAPQFRP